MTNFRFSRFFDSFPAMVFFAIALGVVLGMRNGIPTPIPSPAPQESPPPVSGSQTEKEARLPARLEIPALGVRANIEHVGLDREGNMDIPKHPDDVAWYRFGARPGDAGNAVLAGHYDSDTSPAVFFRLHELREGDVIIITDRGGREEQFRVANMAEYSSADVPLNAVFGKNNERRLNLITCGGEFNESIGGYSHRTVVYATHDASSVHRQHASRSFAD